MCVCSTSSYCTRSYTDWVTYNNLAGLCGLIVTNNLSIIRLFTSYGNIGKAGKEYDERPAAGHIRVVSSSSRGSH